MYFLHKELYFLIELHPRANVGAVLSISDSVSSEQCIPDVSHSTFLRNDIQHIA